MRQNYHAVRPRLRTGDLLFVQGVGFFASLICKTTGPPSHVAIIYRGEEEGEGPSRVEVIESTSLNRWSRKKGVQRNPLSILLANQDPGVAVWAALLREDIRDRINWDLWYSYLRESEGRRYDFLQAAGSALGQWFSFLPSLSIRSSLFCSELASGCLRESGAAPMEWDATPTPHQLALWPIYGDILHIQGPLLPFPQPDPVPDTP